MTVSSINAFLPDPTIIDYCAAKAALTNFSKALSKEVGPLGVRVNTVSPGPVSTALWLGDDGVAARVGRATGADPEAVARRGREPRGDRQVHRPAEVADLVVMLAGDRAGNVTGADLVIDGGYVDTLAVAVAPGQRLGRLGGSGRTCCPSAAARSAESLMRKGRRCPDRLPSTPPRRGPAPRPRRWRTSAPTETALPGATDRRGAASPSARGPGTRCHRPLRRSAVPARVHGRVTGLPDGLRATATSTSRTPPRALGATGVLLVLAALIALGLANVFGQRATTSAAGAAAELTVEAPDRLRGGLLGQGTTASRPDRSRGRGSSSTAGGSPA